MIDQNVTILQREHSEYVSTSFHEILTCRMADGSIRRLLAKRGGAPRDPTFGHRGGVPYEAEIYRRVIEPLGTSVPQFISAETNTTTGETVLLIEYKDDALRLNKAEEADLHNAAHWIGTFHRLNVARAATLGRTLNRYDAVYYLDWAQRALDVVPEVNRPWLTELASHFKTCLSELLDAPATVIHGEYYPANILVHNGTICPIDWESAAIAAGEIDLATLTEGWSDADKQACQAEYGRARWPDGAPVGFEARVDLARVYLGFRWLGDPAAPLLPEDQNWYLEDLHSASQRRGLI